MNNYLTLDQVQKVLPLSKMTLMRMSKNNELKCIKIRTRLLFSSESIEEIIKKNGGIIKVNNQESPEATQI